MKAQSNTKPLLVEILGNKVLVRTNITKVIKTDEHGDTEIYEYDEIRYKKDKYIEFLSNENSNLKSDLQSTQQALDFILMGGM